MQKEYENPIQRHQTNADQTYKNNIGFYNKGLELENQNVASTESHPKIPEVQ